MKSFCQKCNLDLISFLICYQFIGKMGVKERVNSIGKIQMWDTQTQTMQFLQQVNCKEEKKALLIERDNQLQCMDFDFTDLMKPSENKTRPKKLWDNQGDFNSDQTFDDTKELMLVFKYVQQLEY